MGGVWAAPPGRTAARDAPIEFTFGDGNADSAMGATGPNFYVPTRVRRFVCRLFTYIRRLLYLHAQTLTTYFSHLQNASAHLGKRNRVRRVGTPQTSKEGLFNRHRPRRPQKGSRTRVPRATVETANKTEYASSLGAPRAHALSTHVLVPAAVTALIRECAAASAPTDPSAARLVRSSPLRTIWSRTRPPRGNTWSDCA
jgi:hypothetical protein